MQIEPLAKLEASLADSTGMYVNAGVDAAAYCAGLASDIRAHICEPFEVSAIVQAPGFPDVAVGGTVSGLCVAHNESGYWLVYQPAQDRFCCFWGPSVRELDAHGVFGSPLYCWSA